MSGDCWRVFLILAGVWGLTFLVGHPRHAMAGPIESFLHVALLAPLWLGLWLWLRRRSPDAAASTVGALCVTFLWLSTSATQNRLPNPSFIRGYLPFSGKSLAILVALVAIAWLKRGTWRDYGLSWRLRRGTGRVTVLVLASFVALETGLAFGLVSAGVVKRSFYLSMSCVSKMPLWEAAVFQFALVAVAEELVFRGFLQSYLDELLPGRRRLWGADLGWGFWIVLLVFAGAHVIEARTGPLRLVTDPLWLLLGIPVTFAFGFLRSYTGALWPAIVLHGLWDGLGDVLFPELIRHGLF